MARYIVQQSDACGDATPYAVVDTENDNSVEGCFADQQTAQDEADELNGTGGDAGDGTQGDASMEQRGARWEATAAFLDKPTDEMEPRLIHSAGLSFRELPLPLMAMFEDDHGGWAGDTKSVLVGRIEEYEVQGDTLIMRGTYDATDDGLRAEAWAMSGSARVSVDTNPLEYRVTAPKDVVIEEQQMWQELFEVEDGDKTPEEAVAEMPVDENGRVIVSEGKQSDYIIEFIKTQIMGLTMVPFSAFGETHISLEGQGALVAAGMRSVRFFAKFGSTSTPADRVWIGYGDAQENCLIGYAMGADPDVLREVALAVTQRHEALADQLDGFELFRDLYDSLVDAGITFQLDAVPIGPAGADHDSSHLWVGQGEGATSYKLSREALTASGARMAPERPPRAWFEMAEPDELTPLTVDADGRVYGHIAPWEACHLGYPGECKQPPASESDYRYMNRGLVECDDGSLIAAGPIACKGPHADTMMGMREAIAHYENTTRIVADVHVRDGELGIWCSGSIRPDASADDVRDLRATGEVSADWRWVDGNLEMICALAVILGGYPVPRPTALVADGHVRSLVGVQFGEEEIHTMERTGEPVNVDLRLQVLAATARGGLSALRELARA